MSDEIETIDKNPKSWAAWKREAERLQGIIDGMALAAMDSEPVAVREPIAWLNDAYLARGVVDGEAGSEDAGPGYILVYREAQSAPVVPEEMTPQQASRSYGGEVRGYRDGWNACRAAMLQSGILTGEGTKQAEPVTTANKLPELIEGMEVSIDVSTCDADAGNRYFGTVAELSELDGAKNGYILLVQDAKPNFNQSGNSPVIPDTWIPVSERMPDDEQEVLTINKMGYRFVSFFDKHSGLFFDRLDAPSACCIEHVLVTHWMAIPAAPQEVKGE
ncbi:DUF551 domain-containing protein [Klebsiella sp. GW_Kp181]|uniref:DUF551 domain-containing protein n=1 Tax=Klebsiella sp. GW_Kp181 TaxID=3153492 RepID=UPI0032B35301